MDTRVTRRTISHAIEASWLGRSRTYSSILAKETRMSRKATLNVTYVRFALLMLSLVAFAVFMGSDPWGPG